MRLHVRRATGEDLPLVVALFDRCSEDTLYRRFHGAAGHLVRREVERITTPTALHRSWVAQTDDGQVRGTATLAWARTGPPEAAFLVEDAWFRRGIGRALFTALTLEAGHADLDAVVATIQADNRRAQRFLAAVAPDVELVFAGSGEVRAFLALRRPALAGAGR